MGNITETDFFENLQEHEDDVTETHDVEVDTAEFLEVDNSNVERILHGYSLVELEIEELEDRKDASMEFYNDELRKKFDQLKYKDNALKTFLARAGKKSIKFPNGTISTRKSTLHEFHGKEEDLLEWCKETDKNNEWNLIKKTRKPSKIAITKMGKSTGFFPDDWEITERTSFNVKTNRKRS